MVNKLKNVKIKVRNLYKRQCEKRIVAIQR